VSKQRIVDTCFWDDGYIAKLDPSEKLLFLYLLTNPLTTICGVYQIELRRIAFDTGFDPDTVTRMLIRLERDGKCSYREGWIALRNWIKHQRIRNRNVRRGIDRELSAVPPEFADWVQGGKLPSHSKSLRVTPSHIAPNSTKPNSTKPNLTRPNLAVAAKPATPDPFSLHRAIQEAFESKHGAFSDYGKEGAAIKRLIAKASKSFPADPESFLRELLETFWQLKESGDRFWGEQPFTPSALNASGIYDRVCERMRASTPTDAATAQAIEGVFK